ncbi:hypothetical protein [Nocardia sp. NBC_01329]|uniref:hypothetical protein n=1 Tax=Nocardia sp. NBC_01329 TaxID=2903594 RepID=UPI002E157FBF|nr:hypothetical protein OG405_08835 [Nocardia sp. NBC_01329]
MGRREPREERDVSPENRETIRNSIEKELGIPRAFGEATPEDFAAWLSRVENMMEVVPRENRRPFDITDSNGVTDVVGEVYTLRRLADIRRELQAGLRNATARGELAQIRHVADSAIHDPVARQMVADQIQRAQEVVVRAAVAEDARDAALGMELQNVVQDLRERRSKTRWSLFQREPIAVLIGAFLLVGLSVVMVVAMFTGTEVPELVVSLILLILGFFFGQSAAGGRGGGPGDGGS